MHFDKHGTFVLPLCSGIYYLVIFFTGTDVLLSSSLPNVRILYLLVVKTGIRLISFLQSSSHTFGSRCKTSGKISRRHVIIFLHSNDSRCCFCPSSSAQYNFGVASVNLAASYHTIKKPHQFLSK